MIRTYIYGIPHGFNFYENDVEYLEYFKAFYISSRRGRRMVVNRRENGDTVYSYLQYGMREVERQPLHAFFGMSIVFENYEYCSDFKTLLGWFDTIFDKFVKEHDVIKLDSEGTYRYQVHKFEEKPDGVKWLKGNLPNIIVKSNKLSLQKYDDTFLDGSTGQVAGYNHSVSNEQILSALKKYRWVSISSEIIEKTSPETPDDKPTIELNYKELNDKLNELNKESLSIAVDKKKGSIDILNRIAEEIRRNTKSIHDYLLATSDNQEIEKFKELGNGYVTLREQIKTLSTAYSGQETKPQEETRQCLSCKLSKPLSEFSSPDTFECKTCEERHKPPVVATKKCSSCKKERPLSEFSFSNSPVCKNCERHIHIDWGKWLPKILIGVFVVAVTIAAIAFLPKACSNNDVDDITSNVETTADEFFGNSSKIDINEIDRLLDAQRYVELYEYIKDKQDNHQFDQTIRESIEQLLWSKIDNPEVNADTYLATFWIENEKLLDHIRFTVQDKEYWESLNSDYQTLQVYLNKEILTQVDYNKAIGIINNHSEFSQEWRTTIDYKWELCRQKKADKKKREAEDKSLASGSENSQPYILIYTKPDGTNARVTLLSNEGNKGFDALEGSYATVTAPGGMVVKEKQKNSMTVQVKKEKEKPVKITCTDDLVISLTGKKKAGGFKKQTAN